MAAALPVGELAALAREQALPEEEQNVRNTLEWIGFQHAITRERITEESFTTFGDVQALEEGDITSLASSFSKRTPAAQRIQFGQRRIKKLKALIHWAKDFRRCSRPVTIEGLDLNSFNAALDVAARRQEIRQQQMDASDQVMKEASPGKLVSEAKWHEWSPAFENYLSSGFGVDGVPLSYVIRRNSVPDHDGTFQDFQDECIACAPLVGPAFDADKRTVHQMMVSFTQGELAEDWMKPVKNQKNGRADMEELRRFFAGEGNASRRIAVAERMWETLHYRNERAMSFEIFLSKAQRMFNIFEQQKEGKTEDAKVRFLLKKTQCPGLASAVSAVKARLSTDPPGTLTFAIASNHIASCVSELPDYISKNRTISAIKMAPNNGIKREDGSIHTGFYPNWKQLTKEQREQVGAERKRLKGTRKAGGQQSVKTELQNLKKKLGKSKRKIAALKNLVADEKEKVDGDKDGDSDGDNVDAGDNFGGKRQKKAKK